MKNIIVSLLLCCFLISGCTTKQTSASKQSAGLPAWVFNPSGKDYVGGVGIAGTNIKGKSAQRELAVVRALNDIARQMGVSVDNVLKTESQNSQNSSSVMMASYSLHTVNGQTVIAKIFDIWENKSTDEIYVYMRTE